MYARVMFTTCQPGKADEASKVTRDSIPPIAKKQKGFKGLFLLGDRKTGKGITIYHVGYGSQHDGCGKQREIPRGAFQSVVTSCRSTYDGTVRGQR
jgi:hypothetical protein